MIQRTRFAVAALMLAAATCASNSTTAGTVVFPDEMSSNLVYSSIEETNGSIIAGFSYFGGVGIDGEALVFDADNFRSESFGGVDAVDARASFMVTTKNGSQIESVTITEGGRASAFGEGSFANVNAGGFVIIDGQLSAPESVDYTLNAPAAGIANDFWTRSITFNFDPTDKVSVVLDNALFTFAEENGYAFIDKKSVIVNVGTTSVPEPSSALALFALSGGAVLVRRRRR